MKLVLVIILSLLNINVYAFQNELISNTGKFKLTVSKTIEVKENIEPISDIGYIAINNDESFFLTSKNIAQLLLYDSKGNQVKKVSRWGRGPFEYQKPSLVKIYKNKLYLWDQTSFKLIIFTDQGEPVDELNLFASNVSDFSVWDRNVVFYSQRATEDYLSVYDIETKELLFKTGYEIEDEMEHLLLMMFEGSGKLTYTDEAIFYGLPTKNGIAKYSVSQNKTQFIEITDDNFKFEYSEYDNMNELNTDINNAIKYPFYNSRNLGVFKVADKIISIHENGYFDPNDLGERWDLDYDFEEKDRRRHTYFIYDSNLNLIDKIQITPRFQKQVGLQIVGISNQIIAYLKQVYNEDRAEVTRTITFLEFLPVK